MEVYRYTAIMAKITVYLPDDLAERVKAADLNVSQLAQNAIRKALDDNRMGAWLASLDLDGPDRVSTEDAQAAVRAVRDANG
jgi:post-segregation antitoxin (ccd killing protein)